MGQRIRNRGIGGEMKIIDKLLIIGIICMLVMIWQLAVCNKRTKELTFTLKSLQIWAEVSYPEDYTIKGKTKK